MNTCTAVLLDTVSIQDYIFQSNQLKENIGASYLVDDIYKSNLKKVVKGVFGKEQDLEKWRNERDIIRISTEPFEVGFIGGGNALLFFQEKNKAVEFIQKWTADLLVQAPGITTAVACDESFDLDDFYRSKKQLFNKLRKNKGMYIPDTLIPSHGMTAECRHSGLSANVDIRTPDGKIEYVSASTYAKIEATDKAQKEIRKKYSDILRTDFNFTADIGQLGQKGGEESHIAIVHIDGNDMGDRFAETKMLSEIRRLSVKVEEATETAFRHVITHIIEHFSEFKHEFKISQDSDKDILPIRSIVLGGDDVTFVCDGRLGLYFAKIFIEAFQNQEVNGKNDLTACAGIAIIKTKYPFSRGYGLAEALCKNAKDARKARGDQCSYLDFHLSLGGFTGSPSEIRRKHFQAEQGNLIYRPYKLVPEETQDEYSFELLLRKATELQSPHFPRNKLYELREALTLSKEATDRFVRELDFRGHKLPEIPARNYHKTPFENRKTPYFDMIELLELYPQFALPKPEVHNDKL
ncbi:MAG: hypothetical protein RBT80_27910 [Candidatus Vecturithrix sp.]|nr:hypothetical protein [Candidatus Vecturithrix sp.]